MKREEGHFVSLAEFERAPFGRTVRAADYQVWCVDESLCISSVWGRPNVETARDLVRLADVAFHPAMRAPYCTVIDVRHLQSVEPEAFEVLATYVRGRRDLKRRIRRQAILRPGGFVGALAAGFLPVFDTVFPARVFTDPARALMWLGRADAEPLARELAARLEAARELHPIVGAIREKLDADPAALDLSRAARALGVSKRSLQRQLAMAGTTFRDEANAARLRLAQHLLLSTDRKIGSIAIDVGCSSLQHLGLLFRQRLGTSPSEWRARAKAR